MPFNDFLAFTLPDCTSKQELDKHEPWWENFTIKLKLSQIYKDRKSWDSFVDTIYPSVRKSFLEAIQQKVILCKYNYVKHYLSINISVAVVF